MLAAVFAVVVLVSVVAMATLTNESDDNTQAVEKKSFLDYSAAIENIEPVGEPIPVTPALLKHGEWVYRGLCIGCHGANGDGNGAVWELADKYAPEHKLPRRPRDFTQAVFKIRSTPSGSFPTDRDLFISISRGLVADQDMPAFKFLPERDRWAVIAYFKSLSSLWEEEAEYQEPPIEVGESPIPDSNMIAAGKQVYERMKCAKCHGELGLGDGPSAPELEDDSGLPIVPRNFTDASQFVGGADPASIFQTFNTGFDGTPMPSFLDFLDAEQSWQLVWYVISLRTEFDLNATRERMMQERGIPLMAMAPVAPPQPLVTQPQADEPASVVAGVVDKPEPAKKAAAPIGDYQVVAVADGGTIQGKVVYNGSIKRRTVLPTKDKSVCGKSRKEPMIRVGDGGAVAESVVYLKGVKSGKDWPASALEKPVLDQVKCRFEPHVQVARQGEIDIVNSDPVLHNTHGYYGKRTAFNLALPEQGQTVTKVLKRAGTVKVDCDAHGWMLGWVHVVDSPYYFQTGEDGTFSIGDIPPGDYTLAIWQEWLGEREIPVTVTAGGTITVDVDLTK